MKRQRTDAAGLGPHDVPGGINTANDGGGNLLKELSLRYIDRTKLARVV